MKETIGDTLVVDLARDVVRAVAPQEMPLFRANSDAYVKDPLKVLKGGRSGDQFLGFGGGAEVALLTPIVLAVATEVLKLLAVEVAKATQKETAPIIDEQVRRLFRKFRGSGEQATDPAPLNHEQLERVRLVAYETACRLQLSNDQAQVLANSTVGGLVVG